MISHGVINSILHRWLATRYTPSADFEIRFIDFILAEINMGIQSLCFVNLHSGFVQFFFPELF